MASGLKLIVDLVDDGPFSIFRGKSLSASSFHASLSLLRAIDGVVSFICARSFCLKLLNTSDLPIRKPPVMVVFPASLSFPLFPFTPACPGQ